MMTPQVECNLLLDEFPTVTETTKAIKLLAPGKAPESDAISTEVYKARGPPVGKKMTEVITHYVEKTSYTKELHLSDMKHVISLLRLHKALIHTAGCLRQEAVKDKSDDFHSYNPSDYSSYEAFVKGNTEAWKYQPYIVWISAASFMIYFFFLREENQFDKQLEEPLFSSIPALEESTLMAKINENKRKGLDTTDLQKRLNEVREAS